MCSINCIYSPVNKGFIDEISYLRSHNRFKSTCKKLIKYYTDFQDVDEDLRTIMYQGGRWFNGSYAGIMHRGIDNPPTTIDFVASNK